MRRIVAISDCYQRIDRSVLSDTNAGLVVGLGEHRVVVPMDLCRVPFMVYVVQVEAAGCGQTASVRIRQDN